MTVALLHSPADITRWLLVSLGDAASPLTVDPDTGLPTGSWPCYAASEPPTPDNCLTVYDTTARSDGFSMTDGAEFLHEGIQIRVRARDHATGYVKAKTLKRVLDELIYDLTVTIGSSSYLVHCFTDTNLLRVGKETGSSKRDIFTVNAMMVVRDATDR